MAQKYITELIDDIDGTTAEQTITFSLDGKTYAIDLNNGNAADLRHTLQPYITAARKGGGTSTKAKTGGTIDLAAIRTWAKENGNPVADRGRVAADVQDAYRAAH